MKHISFVVPVFNEDGESQGILPTADRYYVGSFLLISRTK